jgi:uncharacterized protein (DUF952 family)
MSRVYKILSRGEWEHAEGRGAFEGSALDLKDGFIHLSDEAQAGETLRLHFAGHADLLKVGFEANTLGPSLKWEPSRGGALFPHLYAPLPTSLAVSIEEVSWPLSDEARA